MASLFASILNAICFVNIIFFKIVIIFTKNVHSMAFQMCLIVEEAFHLNECPEATNMSNINEELAGSTMRPTVLHKNSQTEHFSSNSEESVKPQGTCILVCNLETSRIITIAQEDTKSEIFKRDSNCCKSCHLQSKQSSNESKDNSTTTEDSEIDQSKSYINKSRSYIDRSKYSPVDSNMSIDDVSNADMFFTGRNSHTKHNFNNQSSTTSSNQNLNGNYEDCRVETSVNTSDTINGNLKLNFHTQTSSPIDDDFLDLRSRTYVSFEDSIFNSNCENSSKTFTDSKEKIEVYNSGNTPTYNNSKKRLSLSSNKSSKGELLKRIQSEIVENAIKSTPRHEKSNQEIKYPYSSELNLAARGDEDAKEMLSCSSYESLPVSDHLRNSFENSAIFSLYKENLLSSSTPDFSSVGEFIEVFDKMRCALSVSNLVQGSVPAPLFFPPLSGTDEHKRKIEDSSPDSSPVERNSQSVYLKTTKPEKTSHSSLDTYSNQLAEAAEESFLKWTQRRKNSLLHLQKSSTRIYKTETEDKLVETDMNNSISKLSYEEENVASSSNDIKNAINNKFENINKTEPKELQRDDILKVDSNDNLITGEKLHLAASSPLKKETSECASDKSLEKLSMPLKNHSNLTDDTLTCPKKGFKTLQNQNLEEKTCLNENESEDSSSDCSALTVKEL